MIDPKKLLDELLGSKVPGTGTTVRQTAGEAARLAKENPIATGAIALALLGTGPGRAITGSALKIGGLAAVAGIAYKAYQNYRQGAPGSETGALDGEILPPPEDTGFHPSRAPQGEAEFTLTLVRAMVAAANADGHVDAEERARIGDRITLSGIDDEEGAFLQSELDNPIGIDAIVAAARTEAQKIELYTASRIAVEPNTRAERGYLDLLAGRLGLPDALVDHVEATVAAARR
jgi:uncharacterized membrane protein YebE (DUF533 family)